MKKECAVRKTSIGGQALIEGVMMKGPELSAMAIRKPDGTIHEETWETYKGGRKWYQTIPFVRGSFNFVETMLSGYKCLMRSAELAGFDEEEPSPFEKKLQNLLGDHFFTFLSGVAMVLGAVAAVVLFMVLPTLLVGFLGNYFSSPVLLSAVEGCTKIVIFVLYLAAVSRTKEIYRVFQYHGAEHKTIACYEAGQPLTVENVRQHRRFHPRCGTSFLLIVLVVSILVSSLVTWNNLVIRILLKIIMLPITVGIAYEIIKFAGRHDNLLTRIISAPGLWLQRLTTNEPDDSQIEVAIASMLPCIPKQEGLDNW